MILITDNLKLSYVGYAKHLEHMMKDSTSPKKVKKYGLEKNKQFPI